MNWLEQTPMTVAASALTEKVTDRASIWEIEKIKNLLSGSNMGNQRTKMQRQLADAGGLLLLIIFLPIILPLLIVALTLYVFSGIFLHLAIWCWWCSRGRNVLFVYSNSPIWQEYVEKQILPRLGRRAVILNWSERSRWRRTLAVLAFRYFGGSREFNPLAIVFRPVRFTQSFRFYKPFRDFKHGKTETVTKMEEDFFNLVDKTTEARAISN